jgi:hypothetical protein
LIEKEVDVLSPVDLVSIDTGAGIEEGVEAEEVSSDLVVDNASFTVRALLYTLLKIVVKKSGTAR